MASELLVKDKSDSISGIKISPFRKHIRRTEPHKHNSYLEIIYLSGGSGKHDTDSVGFTIRPPMVLTVRQDQIHHWDMDSEPEGYVLILKREFLDQTIDRELKLLVNRLSSKPVHYLTAQNDIDLVLELLCKEYQGGLALAGSSIEGLLKSFLSKVFSSLEADNIRGTTLKADMYQAFVEFLTLEGIQKRTVSYYAEKLNTTPQNLNAACQRAAGKPALDILHDFVLNEAKRLLLYTDKKSSEIAYLLNFNDPSHFVKFFKRNLGKTPKDFRAGA
ncbi:AraC family transcriptional regulator [uncultured Flavobacterium sp.]|uniref:AraC family transcriptional regulator n=1 Tax=uncultured Flavobacterium sp. TaxID=165435 RepID=UPI0025EA5649|nr:helix-turn-helix transcriptional regulator [uncultured Flavobacterium sp.]